MTTAPANLDPTRPVFKEYSSDPRVRFLLCNGSSNGSLQVKLASFFKALRRSNRSGLTAQDQSVSDLCFHALAAPSALRRCTHPYDRQLEMSPKLSISAVPICPRHPGSPAQPIFPLAP